MSNRQRFLIILQLCFAFSVIFWYSTQPFMGEYFTLRSRMLLYEYVMGNSDILKNQRDAEKKLNRNAERFEQLNPEKQKAINEGYQKLQSYAQRPAWIKIVDGIKVLILKVPPFQLGWAVLAIVIGVLLLLNRSEARQAAWILPLITLIYAFDNACFGKPPTAGLDASLFPSEQVIMQENLPFQSPMNMDQLQQGWNNYLLKNWSSSPKPDLEDAEFNFTIARLMLLYKEEPNLWLDALKQKSNILLLGIYFLWNLFFAWQMKESHLRKVLN